MGGEIGDSGAYLDDGAGRGRTLMSAALLAAVTLLRWALTVTTMLALMGFFVW